MTSDTAVIARRAYDSLEPFHVLAYFNPGLGDAQRELGLDGHAFYVGARACPLGETAGAVVASAFYNFNPGVIAASWDRARTAGLSAVDDRRYRMLDELYRTILGDAANQIAPLLPAFEKLIDGLPLSGRPLGAAWASTAIPDTPHLALWRHLSALREWRGDNHIAALVDSDLSGIDAGVFHEAGLPDPVQRRVMGKRMFLLTRGWSEDDWNASVERLSVRGLVTVDDDGHQLTPTGYELYRHIESRTDEITGSAFSADFGDVIERTRPLVKPILDAGVLPGTRKKG